MLTENVVEFLGLYDDYVNFGLPPVVGGSLDQAVGFVEASRMLKGWEGEKD